MKSWPTLTRACFILETIWNQISSTKSQNFRYLECIIIWLISTIFGKIMANGSKMAQSQGTLILQKLILENL